MNGNCCCRYNIVIIFKALQCILNIHLCHAFFPSSGFILCTEIGKTCSSEMLIASTSVQNSHISEHRNLQVYLLRDLKYFPLNQFNTLLNNNKIT